MGYASSKKAMALLGQVMSRDVLVDVKLTSAVAMLQSSQYHHLLSLAVQKGKGTHEIKRQGPHLKSSPPFNKKKISNKI